MITLKYIKIILCAFGVICLPLNSILLAERSEVEKSVFFDEANKIDKSDELNISDIPGISKIDNIPDVITSWEKKEKGGENDESGKPVPVKIEKGVIRMLPEQAIRAIIDGDFISDSIKESEDVGEAYDNLISLFEAINSTNDFLSNAVYQGQKVANDRVLSAYKAYRTMQRTQFAEGDFAQKEAVKSLNRCMSDKIKEQNNNWITAFYLGMGEGNPDRWREAKEVQKVSLDFKSLLTTPQNGEFFKDSWGLSNHPVKKNPNYKNFLEKSIKQYREKNGANLNGIEGDKFLSVDGLIFFGSTNININTKPAESWLVIFGDYFLIFGDKVTEKSIDGSQQTKKVETVYVKPKYTFEEMYKEIHVERFKDLGKVFYEFCKLRNERNNGGSVQFNDMTEQNSPRIKLFTMQGNVKNEVWNLTVPEKKFDLAYVQALSKVFLDKLKTNATGDQVCDVWQTISHEGTLDKVDLNGKYSSVVNELKNARNYAGYVATSQLLHMIIGAKEYVSKIASGITKSAFDPSTMAEKMILNATGLMVEYEVLIAENLKNWELSDSLMASEAAKVSGEAMKDNSGGSKVITGGSQ